MSAWFDEMTRPPRPPRALAAKTWLARLAAFAERVWPHLWLPVTLISGVIIFGLFDLWSFLPGWFHAIALVAISGVIIWKLVALIRELRWPDRRQALARLERDSGLAHRPLATLEDRPSGGLNPVTEALWRTHLHRLEARARHLKLRMPRLSWVAADPWALRGLAVLLLILGFLIADERTTDRLRLAFQPDFGGAPAVVELDAWATPPDYTGLAPVMLSGRGDSAPIEVPQESSLTAMIEGGWRTPKLKIGGETVAFNEDERERYRIEVPLTGDGTIVVRQGARTRAEWQIRIIPDLAPVAVFTGQPEENISHALRIGYEVMDDYGITDLNLTITGPSVFDRPPRVIPLTPPAAVKEPTAQALYQDLTESPWAGEEVEMMLRATDAIGQEGKSLPMPVTLPEREFNHPVARELVALRKQLFRRPEAAVDIVPRVDDLSRQPQRWNDDLTVFMALRSIYWRLATDMTEEDVDPTAEIMWDTALHLEDGAVSLAQRALRETMDEMMSALSRGENIDRLRQELARRMEELMRAQLENMARSGAMDQQQPTQSGNQQIITPDMLQRMMDQIAEMAASGDQKGAMEMLAQLQQMMENMSMAGAPSQQMMEAAQAANETMQGLEALTRMQRELMNQTVRAGVGQRGEGGNGRTPTPGLVPMPGQGLDGEPQPGGGDMVGELGRRQSELGEMLGDMRGTLEGAGVPTPDSLGEAQGYMDEAARALGGGMPLPAIREQAGALNALREAMRDLQGTLDQAMQQLQAQSGSRDPLGRATSGGMSTEPVKIPTEADFARSREILEELRRRISDPNRPKVERDYLRRLLERF